ncbi:hypothetical protein OROMI_033888 [Orobanche minor]
MNTNQEWIPKSTLRNIKNYLRSGRYEVKDDDNNHNQASLHDLHEVSRPNHYFLAEESRKNGEEMRNDKLGDYCPTYNCTQHGAQPGRNWAMLFGRVNMAHPTWANSAVCSVVVLQYGLGYYSQQAFTIDGFRNWKKVDGKKCVMHMGTECTSFHNNAQKGWDDLLNEVQYIRNVFEKFTIEEREKNRLRLLGNFLEMLKPLGEFSIELKELFCRAPKYASYTSPMIQKEILNIISNKVSRMICEEIGGGRFCLLVDEALDQSHKEQMSVVLRFLNTNDLVIERFLDLFMYVTLRHKLSRMEYILYCHITTLMSSLFVGKVMAASQGVIALRKFFTQLSFVVNVVSASSKSTDQLRDVQVEQIAYLISIDELETGSGLNQIGTLQRAGDTRWSSHLRSVSSLIKMFSPTCEVLLKIIEEGTGSIRGDANSAMRL